jgi:septal ring factor EnvC (AmiA/AmiB activator)
MIRAEPEIADKELITVPTIQRSDELAVFTAKESVDPFLARIRAEIDKFVPNVKTAKGRKEIASIARDVAKVKTGLELVGKRLADEQKEIPKKIDATRKHIKDTLDKWRDEVRKPLTDWEEAEDERKSRHVANINELKATALTDGISAELMRERLAEVKAEVVNDAVCEEYVSDYAVAKDQAIAALETAILARAKHDAEQAELAKLRAEQAERLQAERDAAIAKAAEVKAQEKADAAAKMERDRVEAAAKAEKAAAERRELELKLQAEAAERRALEANQALQREAERVARESVQKAAKELADQQAREADTKHRASINRAAMTALIDGGVPDDLAKKVITLIASKTIPSVSISY